MTTTIPLANILLGIFFFTILGLITLCFSVSVIKDWVRTHCRGDDNTSTNVGTGTAPLRTRMTSTASKSIRRPDRSIQLRSMNSTQQQLIGRVIRSSSSILGSAVPNDTNPTEPITDGGSTRSMENTTTMIDFGTEVIEIENNNTSNNSNIDNNRYNNTDGTSCVICLMEYKVNDTIYRNDPNICHHMFHEECITKWIQQRHYRLKDNNNTITTNNNTATTTTTEPECPCCRNPIAITRIQINENDENNNKNNNENNIPISTTTTTTNTTDASFNAEYVV